LFQTLRDIILLVRKYKNLPVNNDNIPQSLSPLDSTPSNCSSHFFIASEIKQTILLLEDLLNECCESITSKEEWPKRMMRKSIMECIEEDDDYEKISSSLSLSSLPTLLTYPNVDPSTIFFLQFFRSQFYYYINEYSLIPNSISLYNYQPVDEFPPPDRNYYSDVEDELYRDDELNEKTSSAPGNSSNISPLSISLKILHECLTHTPTSLDANHLHGKILKKLFLFLL
jgi:hypothetical protein